MAYIVRGKQLLDVNILDITQFLESGWHVLRKESGEIPVRNLEGTAALEAISAPYKQGDAAVIVTFGGINSTGGPVAASERIADNAPLKNVFTLSRNVYTYKPSSADIPSTELDFEGFSGSGLQNIGTDAATAGDLGGTVFYFAKLWDAHIETGNQLGLPKLYILNFSVPSQSLYSGDWNPRKNSGGLTDLSKRLNILFKAFINKIVMVGENPRLVGLVHNNFELDALEGGDAQENYADLLEKLYYDICATVGIYYLPIYLSNPVENSVINEYTARNIRTQVLNFIIQDSRFRHSLLTYGNDVFSDGYKYSSANFKRHAEQLFSLVRFQTNQGLPLVFNEYELQDSKAIPDGKAGQLLGFDDAGNLNAVDAPTTGAPSAPVEDPFPFLAPKQEAKVGKLYRYIRDDGQVTLVAVNSELSNGRSVYPEQLTDDKILLLQTSRGTFKPFIDISATPDDVSSKFAITDSFFNPTGQQIELKEDVLHVRTFTQDGKVRVDQKFFASIAGIGPDGTYKQEDFTGNFFDISYLAGDTILFCRDSFKRFAYRLIRIDNNKADIPAIIDNTNSDSSTDGLSARIGKLFSQSFFNLYQLVNQLQQQVNLIASESVHHAVTPEDTSINGAQTQVLLATLKCTKTAWYDILGQFNAEGVDDTWASGKITQNDVNISIASIGETTDGENIYNKFGTIYINCHKRIKLNENDVLRLYATHASSNNDGQTAQNISLSILEIPDPT